jgi:hypothetical protein
MTTELRSGTLTKKYLTSLPRGVFLMSNLVGKDGFSVFGEYVISPLSEREKQWQRIVSIGCNNRLCRIFKNEEKALEFVRGIKRKSG